MSIKDSMWARAQQMMAEQRQQDQAALANAQHQPIPGLTGPTSQGQIPGQVPVGMAPPQRPIPTPGVPPQAFMDSGPFGRQAMQMAGLLGGPRPSSIGAVNSLRDAIINRRQGGGILGPPNAGNHMVSQPGNMQTQQGLLGAPPKGFRVPFYRPPGK